MASNGIFERMEQVMSAIQEGAAGAALSQRAHDWLLVRYTRWIASPGDHGDPRTPEEAWSEYQSAFLAKFREIGSTAAELSGGSEIRLDSAKTAAVTVETTSYSHAHCPFCPPPEWS
jgi:hypothetical protein